MSKKPETVFKERVKRDLKTLTNTWFVKIQQVSIRGIPDFLLCINGQFVAIELKRSREAHRDALQEWTLDVIAGAGGYSYICFPDNWNATFDKLQSLSGENTGYIYNEDPH